MGQTGVDIILQGLAQDLIPFSFECKNTETLQLEATIRQARANRKKNTGWAIVHGKNNEKPIVVMSWNSFEQLLIAYIQSSMVLED